MVQLGFGERFGKGLNKVWARGSCKCLGKGSGKGSCKALGKGFGKVQAKVSKRVWAMFGQGRVGVRVGQGLKEGFEGYKTILWVHDLSQI